METVARRWPPETGANSGFEPSGAHRPRTCASRIVYRVVYGEWHSPDVFAVRRMLL